MDKKIAIDWNNLGFSYMKTDSRYISHYKYGKWDEGRLVTDNKLTIREASTVLHHGQQCFEALKAYRRKDRKIQLFRVDENAKRMNKSCDKLLMTEIPKENL